MGEGVAEGAGAGQVGQQGLGLGAGGGRGACWADAEDLGQGAGGHISLWRGSEAREGEGG